MDSSCSTRARSCGHVDRSDYVAENESLLAEFPIFPGATELGRASSGYNVGGEEMFATTDGYITTVEYLVPAGSKNDETLQACGDIRP